MQQATKWNLQYEAQRLELLKRIERWSGWSKFNEDATITGLVLPVLQHLGYDPFDPEQVFPQARDNNDKKPDLVLYKVSPRDRSPAWCVIEVKALDKSLKGFVSQVGQYLMGNTARWYVLTNGKEWRIYDKNHGQNDFHRMTVSLESLGALDVLCALLGKDVSQPDFERAEEIYVIAQLVDAAKQTDWERHQVVWKDGGVLAQSVRDTLKRVRSQFPSRTTLIEEWERNFRECLTKGVPPAWWNMLANPSVGPASMATSGTASANPIDIQSLKGKPELYEGKKPEKLFIGDEQIDLEPKTWAELLVCVVEYLDRRGCLPKPPFKKLYSTNGDNFGSPKNIESRQYGTIYVETSSSTARKIDQLLELLREQQCSDIRPDTVRVKLRDD
jgi:hypothetical protein